MTLSGSYVLLMLLILLDSETTIPPFTRGSLLSMKTTRVLVLVCFCFLPRPHFLFDASAAMDPRHPALVSPTRLLSDSGELPISAS
jgi:hypothetical protein